MILRTIVSILLVVVSTTLTGQSFLNGSFEDNSTTEQCTYNVSNTTYNELMANSTAFGGYESLDIVQNGCYLNGIPDGSFSVSIANNPNDNQIGEAISLELEEPLVIGVSYTFTFQSISITAFGPQGNLLIGASTSPIEFGEEIYEAETEVGVWTEFSISFTATDAITYITVAPVPGVSSWNSVDDFQFIESCQVEGVDEQMSCSPFTWIDGVTYNQTTSSPQFVISGGAVNGCDSLVFLDLTILDPAFGTEDVTSCEPFTWIDGNTYDESVNDIDFTLEAAAVNGCDSIATLNFTLLELEAMVELTADGFICLNENVSYQWYHCTNGITLLEGETNSTFTPSFAGNFFVEITNGECTAQSDCTLFDVSNITEEGVLSISMFPNPSNGQFQLQFSKPTSAELNVYNSLGVLLANSTFSAQTIIRQTLNVESGVYLVVVKNEGMVWVEKLVVN